MLNAQCTMLNATYMHRSKLSRLLKTTKAPRHFCSNAFSNSRIVLDLEFSTASSAFSAAFIGWGLLDRHALPVEPWQQNVKCMQQFQIQKQNDKCMQQFQMQKQNIKCKNKMPTMSNVKCMQFQVQKQNDKCMQQFQMQK